MTCGEVELSSYSIKIEVLVDLVLVVAPLRLRRAAEAVGGQV